MRQHALRQQMHTAAVAHGGVPCIAAAAAARARGALHECVEIMQQLREVGGVVARRVQCLDEAAVAHAPLELGAGHQRVIKVRELLQEHGHTVVHALAADVLRDRLAEDMVGGLL